MEIRKEFGWLLAITELAILAEATMDPGPIIGLLQQASLELQWSLAQVHIQNHEELAHAVLAQAFSLEPSNLSMKFCDPKILTPLFSLRHE